jgi:hypothetical protein
MATRTRSKKDQAITTQSPVVCALLILATIDDFNKSWRSIEDISCIIQSVFDLPRTKKNQLSGTLIVTNLSNDALTKESVDLQVNDIGIFRDEFQRKTSDGKKKRTNAFISVRQRSYHLLLSMVLSGMPIYRTCLWTGTARE